MVYLFRKKYIKIYDNHNADTQFTLCRVPCQQTFVLMKTSFAFVFRRRLDQDQYIRLRHTSSRRSKDVFMTFYQEVFMTSFQDVFKTSLRDLQDVLQKRIQDIFKTYSRHLQEVLLRRLRDVFKTSSRHFTKMSSRRFKDVSSS